MASDSIEDFELIADLAIPLVDSERKAREQRLKPWEGSSLKPLLMLPSSTRGKIAKEVVAGWLSDAGHDVRRSGSTESDRLVDGHKVVIKSSTLWDDGTFRFQQFRDQDYEVGICIGIAPADVYVWVAPKETILAETGGQHTGQNASETKWLRVDPKAPPAWLKEFGGALEIAAEALDDLLD